MEKKFKIGDKVKVIRIIKDFETYNKYLNEKGTIEHIYGDGSDFGNQIKFNNEKIRTSNCFDNKELILDNNINKRLS